MISRVGNGGDRDGVYERVDGRWYGVDKGEVGMNRVDLGAASSFVHCHVIVPCKSCLVLNARAVVVDEGGCDLWSSKAMRR